MMKKLFIGIILAGVLGYAFIDFSFPLPSQSLTQAGDKDESKDSKPEIKDTIKADSKNLNDPKLQKVVFKIDAIDNLDDMVEDYMKDYFPIISAEALSDIQTSKYVNKILVNDTLGIVEFYLNFYAPKNYLAESPKILWELNIPEFTSRIYQLYENDTILIDIWPNVVGKPSTKTYTGHYEAFRLRNWPSWKDPESGDSVRPTPPGPNNPLGLFVVHYDENSLRYFHGTNKNYLLKNEYRALSHGCVRNDNGNIAKMKEFICKRIVRSKDLTSWLGNKTSMIYDLKEEDKFPVRIIYKTFDINSDSYGSYIIFFKDIYSYAKGSGWSKFDVPELMTFTNSENILAEYKKEIPKSNITDDKLISILENLISSHKDYEKYYFSDLLKGKN